VECGINTRSQLRATAWRPSTNDILCAAMQSSISAGDIHQLLMTCHVTAEMQSADRHGIYQVSAMLRSVIWPLTFRYYLDLWPSSCWCQQKNRQSSGRHRLCTYRDASLNTSVAHAAVTHRHIQTRHTHDTQTKHRLLTAYKTDTSHTCLSVVTVASTVQRHTTTHYHHQQHYCFCGNHRPTDKK